MTLVDRMVRLPLIVIFHFTGRLKPLVGRARPPASATTRDDHHRPLNWFERWLLAPVIAGLKNWGPVTPQDRRLCLDVLGQNPSDWQLNSPRHQRSS